MKQRARVHYLPIEPIESRYTTQMREWVISDLMFSGFTWCEYLPKFSASKIESGQFLDNYGTLKFKQAQLSELVDGFKSGLVNDGDIILVGDVWFTGLECIRMISDLAGIKVKIAGWHHAGVFDPHDYYTKTLSSWSRSFERMIVSDVCDFIICGSQHQFEVITKNHQIDPSKVLPYGMPLKPADIVKVAGGEKDKEPIAVFSHRLAPEKAPEDFVRAGALVKLNHPEWRFVFSSTQEPSRELVELNKEMGSPCEFFYPTSKKEYYELLARASIVYSAGHQETFGYSVNEAMVLGCLPCLPDRVCYPETVEHDTFYLYDSSDPWGVKCLHRLIESGDSRRNEVRKLPARYTHSTKRALDAIEIG